MAGHLLVGDLTIAMVSGAFQNLVQMLGHLVIVGTNNFKSFSQRKAGVVYSVEMSREGGDIYWVRG